MLNFEKLQNHYWATKNNSIPYKCLQIDTDYVIE